MNPSSIRRRQLLAWSAAAPLLGWTGYSRAQGAWPSKIIKMVVAFPEGVFRDLVLPD